MLLKITSSGADTVLTGNWGPDAARLIKASANSELKVQFYHNICRNSSEH